MFLVYELLLEISFAMQVYLCRIQNEIPVDYGFINCSLKINLFNHCIVYSLFLIRDQIDQRLEIWGHTQLTTLTHVCASVWSLLLFLSDGEINLCQDSPQFCTNRSRSVNTRPAQDKVCVLKINWSVLYFSDLCLKGQFTWKQEFCHRSLKLMSHAWYGCAIYIVC